MNSNALQISIGWLYVISSVIPLALKGILPIHTIPIEKIPLSAKGITNEITDNHPIDICSVECQKKMYCHWCLEWNLH